MPAENVGDLMFRLCQRPAAGAYGIDARRMAHRSGYQQVGHRPVCRRRHALYAQIPLVAADGRHAFSRFIGIARPPPRLAARHPAGADGRYCAGHGRSVGQSVAHRAAGVIGRHLLGQPGHRHRRLPRRNPRARTIRGRGGGHRAGLPLRHDCFLRRCRSISRHRM